MRIALVSQPRRREKKILGRCEFRTVIEKPVKDQGFTEMHQSPKIVFIDKAHDITVNLKSASGPLKGIIVN